MNAPDNTSSPSDRIRQATWHRHKRIEQCDILKRLFSPDYRLEEYALQLERFYGFYRAVEPLLAGVLEANTESAFRRPPKLPLLISDMEKLGRFGVIESTIFPRLPPMETPEDAIGVSYVLEGATNGGIFISKHLARHFGESVENALGFYQSYGDATIANWTAFKQALDHRYRQDEAAITALINAADSTYQCFTEWLDQAV